MEFATCYFSWCLYYFVVEKNGFSMIGRVFSPFFKQAIMNSPRVMCAQKVGQGQISFWCSSLAHSFKHQSISTPNSSLIVHFTVLAVYTHSKLVFGLFAFITIRIKDQHGILLHQITFGASISPSSHFFLFRAHFSGWFLYYSSLLVFLSLPVFFVFYSLFWMISLL